MSTHLSSAAVVISYCCKYYTISLALIWMGQHARIRYFILGSRGDTGCPDPPSDHIHVVALKNAGTCTDPSREAIGSNYFSSEVRTAPCEIRWWEEKKRCQNPSDGIFWICACKFTVLTSMRRIGWVLVVRRFGVYMYQFPWVEQFISCIQL